jgi:hypothetical protein
MLVWTRPEHVDGMTDLQHYGHRFARWLVPCLPEDEELQDEVSRQILIGAQPGARLEVRILASTLDN